jgi:hypothetical protein
MAAFSTLISAHQHSFVGFCPPRVSDCEHSVFILSRLQLKSIPLVQSLLLSGDHSLSLIQIQVRETPLPSLRNNRTEAKKQVLSAGIK